MAFKDKAITIFCLLAAIAVVSGVRTCYNITEPNTELLSQLGELLPFPTTYDVRGVQSRVVNYIANNPFQPAKRVRRSPDIIFDVSPTQHTHVTGNTLFVPTTMDMYGVVATVLGYLHGEPSDEDFGTDCGWTYMLTNSFRNPWHPPNCEGKPATVERSTMICIEDEEPRCGDPARVHQPCLGGCVTTCGPAQQPTQSTVTQRTCVDTTREAFTALGQRSRGNPSRPRGTLKRREEERLPLCDSTQVPEELAELTEVEIFDKLREAVEDADCDNVDVYHNQITAHPRTFCATLPDSEQSQLQAAYTQWRTLGLNIDETCESYDVMISWEGTRHGDFDFAPGVLAHAIPGTPGRIHLNSNEVPPTAWSFVIFHEIGHILGLGHSLSTENAMYFRQSGTYFLDQEQLIALGLRTLQRRRPSPRAAYTTTTQNIPRNNIGALDPFARVRNGARDTFDLNRRNSAGRTLSHIFFVLLCMFILYI